MADDTASFRWCTESMLDTLAGFARAVKDTLQPQLKPGDAAVLDYLREVEIPRLKAVYTLSCKFSIISIFNTVVSNGSADGSRPRPPFEESPPADATGFFQALLDEKKEKARAATTKVDARNDNVDSLKPKNSSNRVKKQKKTRFPRSTGVNNRILVLKSQEKKHLSLSRDGQPPFLRLAAPLFLNSSETFKRLVVAKRQRLIDDEHDKICYNPRNTQVQKQFINDFTIYIDGLIESSWAKKQAGYTELAALGKEVIWELFVRWSAFIKGDEKFGGGEECEAVTKEDLANLAVFGKFWRVGPEFDAGLEKARALIEGEEAKEKAMGDNPLDHIPKPQLIMGRTWDNQLFP